MNCEKARLIIIASEGGDATQSETRRLEHHLSRCATCHAFARRLQPLPLSDVRAALPLGENDFAEIRRSVLSAVAAEPRPRAAAFGLRFAAYSATAFVLVIGLVIGLRKPESRASAGIEIASAIPRATPAPEIVTNAEPQPSNPTIPVLPEASVARVARPAPEPSPLPEKEAVAVAAVDQLEPAPMRIEIRTSDPNIRIIWITASQPSESSEVLTRTSDT